MIPHGVEIDTHPPQPGLLQDVLIDRFGAELLLPEVAQARIGGGRAGAVPLDPSPPTPQRARDMRPILPHTVPRVGRRQEDPLTTPPAQDAAVTVLEVAYRGVGEAVAGLPEPAFLRPTRCAGWAVLDVLAHLLMDAQRGLVALASPTIGPADVDFVSYWRGHSPDHPRAAAHARFVRVTAAAYSRPAGLVAHFEETAAAVARAARAAPPEGRVATQGHVLRRQDLVATLTVEAAVHHLDLIDQLPGSPGPDAEPLALARRTLDGLLGRPQPVGWDDEVYALKGTGRLALTAAEREVLGALAARFPLFG